MASLKEIKRRLGSVRNTKKITYAMKLVSAAKLRRAQEAVAQSRQYRNALNNLLAELLAEQNTQTISHPLLETRSQVKTVRLLVVGGSRGLCGGYNANINRKVEAVIREKQKANPSVKIEAVLVGRKPAEYFRRVRREYLESFEVLPEDPNRWPIEQICARQVKDYSEGLVDEVVLIYTRYKSAISMSIMADKLIPMSSDVLSDAAQSTNKTKGAAAGITLFEPTPAQVFSAILPRIIGCNVRQACLDARASEQGSRMTAMDAATKNANELSQNLQLTYNNRRQLGITSQLLDIVGGAEALK